MADLDDDAHKLNDELVKMVDVYVLRKFGEDIEFLEQCGGLRRIKNMLKVDLNTGIISDDNFR